MGHVGGQDAAAEAVRLHILLANTRTELAAAQHQVQCMSKELFDTKFDAHVIREQLDILAKTKARQVKTLASELHLTRHHLCMATQRLSSGDTSDTTTAGDAVADLVKAKHELVHTKVEVALLQKENKRLKTQLQDARWSLSQVRKIKGMTVDENVIVNRGGGRKPVIGS